MNSTAATAARLPSPPVGAAAALLLTFALCASSWAVEVEPSRLELKVTPGQPAHAELQISNRGHKAVEVRLSAGPYRFLDPKLKIPSGQDWFHFEPERLTLAAGASTSVHCTVTPPDNLDVDTAGEYLAAILVDPYPAPEEKKEPPGEGSPPEPRSRLTIVPRLALAAYLMIEGKERVEVELLGVKTSRFGAPPPPQQGGEGEKTSSSAPSNLLRIDVSLKNKGSVHVRPSGTYVLFDGKDHLVRTAPLGKGMPLLPGAEMDIPALLQLPPAGLYRLVTSIEVQEGNVLQKEVSFKVTEEGDVVPQKEAGA